VHTITAFIVTNALFIDEHLRVEHHMIAKSASTLKLTATLKIHNKDKRWVFGQGISDKVLHSKLLDETENSW
jgi:hypothetical protein